MYNEQDPANPKGMPRPNTESENIEPDQANPRGMERPKLARKQVYQDDPVSRRAMRSVRGRNLGQAIARTATSITGARTSEENQQMSTPDESGLLDPTPMLKKVFNKKDMADSGWEEI